MLVCGLLCLPLVFAACRKAEPAPATLTILDPEWLRPDEIARREREFEQFTRETGTKLKFPPTPETPSNQLELWRNLLQGSNPPPDVSGIDVIWPGVLSDELIDLKPYFQTELAAMNPKLVESYTVGDKVVAIPYHTLVGVLAYRTDLLREYGYKKPPATWDELEKMALRIQTGERAKGKSDFWGFAWQGTSAEALTCNALEWQLSQGGGSIIENDKTISVNNPAVLGGWERAKKWVGWISPPSVVAYRELDSADAWEAGRVAFVRTWLWRYRLAYVKDSKMGLVTGYTSLPGGRGGRFGALGGSGLAVSRASKHREEAIALIRFMIQREDAVSASSAGYPELVDVPQGLLRSAQTGSTDQCGEELAIRPSNVTAGKYEEVSKAYYEAVHSVLTGKESAQGAGAQLERQLVQITGFKTGPPPKASNKER